MEAILEVVKYILPSLVVFGTVYYLMKQYIEGQLRLKSLDIQSDKDRDGIPIRLQSLERMALFCERIRLQNLALRLNAPSITAEALGQAMLISIQKEYEHNMAQQIYVSENLWNIILFAKNQNLELVGRALDDAEDFLVALGKLDAERNINPVDAAMVAIRQESSLYL